MCGKDDKYLDAHHIVNRDEMPYGGYVRENGIALCTGCHIKAENEYFCTVEMHPDFSSDKLYILIGSSKELAIEASERLKDV
jgi:hypothetical protein